MIITKRKLFDIFFIIIFILFFVPYLGTLGEIVFSNLGKYYYIIVCSICLINFVLRDCCYLESINYFKQKSGLFLTSVLFGITLLFAFNTLLCAIINKSIDNYFFSIILLFEFIFFLTYRFTTKNLYQIGKISICLLLLIFLITVIRGKITYFNPNSYALISSVLFFFSCLYAQPFISSRKTLVFIINLIIAILNAYVFYKSETQLLTILVFVLLLCSAKFFNNKKYYRFIIFAILLCVVLLPLISYMLIKANMLTESFISDRGHRWVETIDKIKQIGFFTTTNDVSGSHNGFLDLCVKYTSFVAVIFIIEIYVLLLKLVKFIQIGRDRLLFVSILALIFMNCVESIFVGLTDGHFLFISLGIFVSGSISNKSKTFRGEYNGKIYS